MSVKGLFSSISDRNGAGARSGKASASKGEVSRIAADKRFDLLAVSIGISAAVALVGIELFVLYNDILDLIPAVIVEGLQLTVNLLRLLA